MTNHGRVASAAIPTSRDLISAMRGDIPKFHPGVDVLRAAFMISTVDYWVCPDEVAVEEVDGNNDFGTDLLHQLGFEDVTTYVTAPLVDRINFAIGSSDIGPAVVQLAKAWRSYRWLGPSAKWLGDSEHSELLGALTKARRNYTALRSEIRLRREYLEAKPKEAVG